MDRVIFELDCIRVDTHGGPIRVSLTVKVEERKGPQHAEMVTRFELQRDYPANWNAAEAGADLLAIYRDTPYTATRGE